MFPILLVRSRWRTFRVSTLIIIMLLSAVWLFADLEVDIPSLEVNTTDPVSVAVTVSGIENEDIFSLYSEIHFNSSVLQLADASLDNCVTSDWSGPYFNTIGDSIVTLAAFGTSALSEDGDLFVINFDIIVQNDSTSTLSFLNFVFNEGEPQANLSNGQITVTNRIPQIVEPEDVNAIEGDLIDFQVNAADPFGLSLTLEAINLPDSAAFEDDGFGIGYFEWQTDQFSAGEYTVGFSATNTQGFSDTVFVDITVENMLNVWLPQIDTDIVPTITIPIYTDELASLGIYSFYTKIVFDPEVIEATSVSTGGTLCENWGSLNYNLNEPGEIVISAFDTEELSSSGNLIDLEFDVLGYDGSFTDLEFDFFYYNEGMPQVDLISGILYIGTPVAEFSADIFEGYSPLNIQFTDLSVAGPNEIISWEWDFGDGETSDLQNPTHTFLETGEYTVALTVTNSESNQNTEVKIDYITVLPIEAGFTASPTSGYFPAFEVSFYDDSEGNITSWYWDFQNDGVYDSFEQNPVYTYTEAGTFSVKLMVSDDTNYSTFIRENLITVQLVPPKAPENLHIEVNGYNIDLSWEEVTESILNTPMTVDYYLVYAASDPDGQYSFVGFTADPSFTHSGVLLFVDKMFYRVKAFIGTREALTREIDER